MFLICLNEILMQFIYRPLLLLFLLPLLFSIFSCSDTREKRVLVFSKTAGFRHASIPDGIAAIKKLGREHGFKVFTAEKAEDIKEEYLKNFSAVIFLSTTGDILNNAQQADFERFIQAGGGYVGIHAAADTEYSWPWYGKLVGGYFVSHPKIQLAGIDVLSKDHPATKMLPNRWERTDEWYNYKDLNSNATVLMNLDEKSYEGGENGESHPIAWYHEFDGGRAFYTGGGHTSESYEEALFLSHILGGIEWAIGPNKLDYKKTVTYRVPKEDRFVKTVLASNLHEPMELDIFDDGRIIFVERTGKIKLWNPKTESMDSITTMPVWSDLEDGLMGIAIDPNYEENHWIYVYYAPLEGAIRNQIARFEFDGKTWDYDSEKVILEVATQRDECCHSGGSLEFDAHGNLFLSTGDNTNPFFSNGYAPIDERPGRSPWDAQKSSANTNDLRGKIMRIHPEPDGSYTIPIGNLFPEGTPNTRPEIYAMGCRNPFRISIDKKKDWLYWGDVGPDAGKDGELRGPKGIDEINQAKKAGFFGWPYFRGDQVYYDYNFATKKSGDLFKPEKPINDSPFNSGLKELPPFTPPLIWYSYDESEEFPWVETGGKNPMAGPIFYSEDFAKAENAFPEYFNDKLFIYEWMRHWIFIVKMDSTGNFVKADRFMSSTEFSRPMDMVFGKDGALYILEYGTQWFARNADARLSKVEYVKGNRPPIAKMEADIVVGAAPLLVNFTAAASIDYDEDPLTYEWTFDGAKSQSNSVSPAYTFKYPGTYKVKLKVKDTEGNASIIHQTIEVGNTPPEIEWSIAGNQSFYWDNQAINYQVSVQDQEDGSLEDGSILSNQINVTIDYLPEGKDLTIIAQGHQTKNEQTPFLPSNLGKNLIEQSDCKNCHAQDRRINGPSYTEIANHYHGDDFAVRNLSTKILEGGGGSWGMTAMAAHPQLTADEASEMVIYILSMAGKKTVESAYSPAGNFQPKAHLKKKEKGTYVFMASYKDKGNQQISPIQASASLFLRYPLLEAEKADFKSKGLNIATFFKDNDAMGAIRNGKHLGFEAIDLTDIVEIQLRAAIQEGGIVEIRIDSETGQKIGEIALEKPDAKIKMKSFPIPVLNTAGKHDVFFIFKNEAQTGDLIAIIDWVYFENG